MSKIDEMIKDLCPEGVERVKLGDILDYKQPGPYIVQSTSYDDSYSTPVLTAGQSFILGFTNETSGIYSASKEKPCIIFDDFTIGFHWVDFSFKVKSSAMKMLCLKSNKALLRYTYYAMTCIGFIPIEHSRHWISLYSQFEIPLPPLPIQQEIVSVLDSFTTLIDKMKQEVEKRKKQMEYYREELLSPKADYEVKTLGELGTFTRGNGLQKTDFTEEGYPCIHYGQIHTYYGTSTYSTKSFCDENFAQKLRKAKTGDLLIATTSEDVEACCKATVWLGEGEVAFSGDSYCYSHNLNPKYIAYLFQTEMFAKQKRMVAKGAKVVRVTGESMAEFSFYLPSLAKQAEIVTTLDKFESYISKLERMIMLRQKQYDFYREQLLTFNYYR